jgi:hypothetical protein
VQSGRYEVSNLGAVRRAIPGISTYVGRPCRPQLGPGGYEQVCLSGESSPKQYVHRLVAEAFCQKPDGCNVVNHKDRIRSNNNASNLEWVTQRENVAHWGSGSRPRYAPKMVREKKPPLEHWTKRMPERIARAERMPHSKMTAQLVLQVRQRVMNGETQSKIAAEFGISVAQMSRIINKTRWKNV